MLRVEVIYALANEQNSVALSIHEGTTVEQTIQQSGLLEKYPAIDLTQHKIGIFSRIVTLDTLVQAGDRIEIYRPLTMDPKQKRRIKAKS